MRHRRGTGGWSHGLLGQHSSDSFMLRILQVRMKCAAGTSAHLGSTESLELKIETLVGFNNSTTV